MSKEPRRSPSDRMIHIRLDEETHRLVKVQAAQQGMTIQRLVENIIRSQIVAPENRSAKR
jgi:predicted HicB family RNase H-like nuclease